MTCNFLTTVGNFITTRNQLRNFMGSGMLLDTCGKKLLKGSIYATWNKGKKLHPCGRQLLICVRQVYNSG
jgi:hypothetical protein